MMATFNQQAHSEENQKPQTSERGKNMRQKRALMTGGNKGEMGKGGG